MCKSTEESRSKCIQSEYKQFFVQSCHLLQDIAANQTRISFARQFARIVIFFGTIPVLCANQIISARQNLIQLVPIFPSEHASLYFPGLTQVEIKVSQHFSLFFQARQRRSSLFQDSHDYCSETILLLSINCLALSSLPTTLTIACTHRKKSTGPLSRNCPATVHQLSCIILFFRLDEGAHHCFNSQDYRSETVLLLPINCPALSFFFRSGKGAHCCFTGATSFFLSFSSFHLSFSHFIRRFPLFICRFPFFICCFPLFICRFLCFTGRFFGPIASIPLLSD